MDPNAWLPFVQKALQSPEAHGKWALSRDRNARALLDRPEIVNREDLVPGLGAVSSGRVDKP
jgi:hypothetical protein